MKNLKKILRTTWGRFAIAAVVIILFAALGAVIIKLTHAATPFLGAEAEAGTLSGATVKVTDTTASGGSAVKFPAAVVTPPSTITKLPAQPALVAYGSTSVTALAPYAHAGTMVIAPRDDISSQGFKNISAAGGTVLVYLDTVMNSPEGVYHALLYNSSACGAAVPAWPGNPSVNEYGHLADFRVGGVEQSKLECVLEKIVADNPHIGGFFADDLGSRSWFPDLNWDSFGASNQQAYRDGAVALVQTFHKVADKHGIILMVNGTWSGGTLASSGGGYPDMSKSGNALAESGMVEHHTASELPYFSSYACSTQWAAQSNVTHGVAFMWAVTTNDTDRNAYANSNCFAYVNNQDDYGTYPGPWTSFHATGLPSKVAR